MMHAGVPEPPRWDSSGDGGSSGGGSGGGGGGNAPVRCALKLTQGLHDYTYMEVPFDWT